MITYQQALQMAPSAAFERPIHMDAYAWKRAAIVSQNIEAMVTHEFDGGPGNRRYCGLLTLTFPWENGCARIISNHRNLDRFYRFLRTVLKKRFRAGIWVIETTDSGLLHVHALVVSDRNLAEGFDWTAYHSMKRLEAQARSEGRPLTREERSVQRRLGRSLTTNEHLQGWWSDLRKYQAQGRIGRAELTPIREAPAKVASYMAKSLSRGGQRADLEPKTHRFGSWGWTWDRNVSDRPAGPRRARYQQNRKALAQHLGIPVEGEGLKVAMRALFGSRWGYHSLRASLMIDRYRRGHLEAMPPSEELSYIIQVTLCNGAR